jgi:hypothetical protein
MIDPQRAVNELTQRAVQQIQEAEAITEIQRLAQSSEYGRYTALPAAVKVQELYNAGKITSVDQAKQAYAEALENENRLFRSTIKPGYERSKYEGLVSDTEVSDYIAERRAQQNELKEEGKRISGIHSR